MLELISNWIDLCLIQKPETMTINAFSLTWNKNDFWCSTFQSCRMNISDDLPRQDKCSSCTRLVNPYWYLQLLQMANQDLLHFWLLLRNVTLPHKTSKYHLLCKKKKKRKKKTVVNSNQSNYTRENYLHIASIIMISNNGYLIPKICVMYSVMMY